ncbi:MAG: hypothetical protein H7Z10_00460 [Gemmatimonadaceae bacterium]|nr:hypothetical protein [Acetobacteraceae bacterium]
MEEACPESFDKMARPYKACGEQTVAMCEGGNCGAGYCPRITYFNFVAIAV